MLTVKEKFGLLRQHLAKVWEYFPDLPIVVNDAIAPKEIQQNFIVYCNETGDFPVAEDTIHTVIARETFMSFIISGLRVDTFISNPKHSHAQSSLEYTEHWTLTKREERVSPEVAKYIRASDFAKTFKLNGSTCAATGLISSLTPSAGGKHTLKLTEGFGSHGMKRRTRGLKFVYFAYGRKFFDSSVAKGIEECLQ